VSEPITDELEVQWLEQRYPGVTEVRGDGWARAVVALPEGSSVAGQSLPFLVEVERERAEVAARRAAIGERIRQARSQP
jgi:hypothetical protein